MSGSNSAEHAHKPSSMNLAVLQARQFARLHNVFRIHYLREMRWMQWPSTASLNLMITVFSFKLCISKISYQWHKCLRHIKLTLSHGDMLSSKPTQSKNYPCAKLGHFSLCEMSLIYCCDCPSCGGLCDSIQRLMIVDIIGEFAHKDIQLPSQAVSKKHLASCTKKKNGMQDLVTKQASIHRLICNPSSKWPNDVFQLGRQTFHESIKQPPSCWARVRFDVIDPLAQAVSANVGAQCVLHIGHKTGKILELLDLLRGKGVQKS